MSNNWNGQRGAVTWVDSLALPVGAVGSGNSYVGANALDRIGDSGIENLGSGKAAIFSRNWSGGMGAVTWLDVTAGGAGVVDATNSLVGSTAGDQIGGFGNYDFVGARIAILSPNWTNGSFGAAGAITWVDPSNGLTGVVGAGNSLVGGSVNDRVGNNNIDYRDGTHYLVRTTAWADSAGALTWVDSASPPVGVVDATNSLVGSIAGDQVGSSVQNLFNGKSLVRSPAWNGNRGAVTWFDNLAGTFGVVDATNSLVGSTPGTTGTGDRIGANSHQQLGSMIALRAPNWNNGAATLAGAVTFADAFTGVTGAVSAANSLVGSTANDRVGSSSVTSFSNGNYYLYTSAWNGNAGAVTFIDPTAPPLVGAVGLGNSLVGGTAGDFVGDGGVQNLFNGKALVSSPDWNGTRGAVTWFDTTGGTFGTVSAGNSLVGSTAGDAVSASGRFTLGGFMGIRSPNWDNGGIVDAGAITWVDPFNGLTGAVSSSNSLVGGNANDRVGNNSADYISGTMSAVRTNTWNGNMGAVTWINPAAPTTGLVSAGNSLVGSAAGDQVGNNGFSYGSGYLVMRSSAWSAGRGAVTWIDPAAPLTGQVSSANSLVGANPNDFVGNSGVSFMSNGNYYVRSTSFGGGAGAVSVGASAGGISGVVSAANSLVGQSANDGYGGSISELSGSRLLVRAFNADSGGLVDNGRVHIYTGGAGGGGGPGGPLGGQAFSDNSASLITISPAQITAILNTGTSVTLQANSDITLGCKCRHHRRQPVGGRRHVDLAGRAQRLPVVQHRHRRRRPGHHRQRADQQRRVDRAPRSGSCRDRDGQWHADRRRHGRGAAAAARRRRPNGSAGRCRGDPDAQHQRRHAGGQGRNRRRRDRRRGGDGAERSARARRCQHHRQDLGFAARGRRRRAGLVVRGRTDHDRVPRSGVRSGAGADPDQWRVVRTHRQSDRVVPADPVGFAVHRLHRGIRFRDHRRERQHPGRYLQRADRVVGEQRRCGQSVAAGPGRGRRHRHRIR